MSEKQQQGRNALSAHRPYETRALRLPNAQEGLHFVVSFARARTDDERCHRRRRVIGLDHRGDLRRAVRKSRDRIAIGPRERCVGEAFRSGCRGYAASARPFTHWAKRLAAAAQGRIRVADLLNTAVNFYCGHMARRLVTVLLPGNEPCPESGKATSKEGQNDEESYHDVTRWYPNAVSAGKSSISINYSFKPRTSTYFSKSPAPGL